MPEVNEQWLSGGDCSLCRRSSFCRKPCKPAQRRNASMMASIYAQAIAKRLGNVMLAEESETSDNM